MFSQQFLTALRNEYGVQTPTSEQQLKETKAKYALFSILLIGLPIGLISLAGYATGSNLFSLWHTFLRESFSLTTPQFMIAVALPETALIVIVWKRLSRWLFKRAT